jgi:hypothetical protein
MSKQKPPRKPSDVASITLTLDDGNYTIPAKCVMELVQGHRELFHTKHYTVQARVSYETFNAFVDWMEEGRTGSVPPGYAEAFATLATEFGIAYRAADDQGLGFVSLAGPECTGRSLSPEQVWELEWLLEAVLARLDAVQAALARCPILAHSASEPLHLETDPAPAVHSV